MRLPGRRRDDAERLAAWWARLRDRVPDGVVGLWFGITEDRTVYVAGSDTFDPDDGDWAAADYAWWPRRRYVRLPGLAALPGYEAVEARVAELVTALRPWEGVPGLAGVGCGYDDGDVTVVWQAGR
jgi:hypothetical protein